MQLTNPGCNVEEKAKPSHPVEKLHLADFAALGRKPTDRVEHLAEEAENPTLSLGRRAFKTRIAFANVGRGD